MELGALGAAVRLISLGGSGAFCTGWLGVGASGVLVTVGLLTVRFIRMRPVFDLD